MHAISSFVFCDKQPPFLLRNVETSCLKQDSLMHAISSFVFCDKQPPFLLRNVETSCHKQDSLMHGVSSFVSRDKLPPPRSAVTLLHCQHVDDT